MLLCEPQSFTSRLMPGWEEGFIQPRGLGSCCAAWQGKRTDPSRCQRSRFNNLQEALLLASQQNRMRAGKKQEMHFAPL